MVGLVENGGECGERDLGCEVAPGGAVCGVGVKLDFEGFGVGVVLAGCVGGESVGAVVEVVGLGWLAVVEAEEMAEEVGYLVERLGRDGRAGLAGWGVGRVGCDVGELAG